MPDSVGYHITYVTERDSIQQPTGAVLLWKTIVHVVICAPISADRLMVGRSYMGADGKKQCCCRGHLAEISCDR
jgi:hypothetical protein